MTATVNASTSAGVIVTSDTSGALALQTAGTTALTISSAQVVNFANAPTVAGVAIVSTATPTALGTVYGSTSSSNSIASIGYQSLNVNTGTLNSAIGYQSGILNTSGSSNSYIGSYAGYYVTTGSYNTACGVSALANQTVGSTGSYNTALGAGASYFTTSGGNNTAVGYQTLYYNSTASNNTALGYRAGYATTGQSNVAIGSSAMANGTGTNSAYNIAIGGGTLASFTLSGSYGFNICIGQDAGTALVSGIQNTFIGTGFGVGSGRAMTGNYNTILGPFTGNQSGLNISGSSNYIVLSDGEGTPRMWMSGAGLFCPVVQSVTGAATANVYVDGSGNLYRATSSLKYKTDVQDATHGLQDLLKLRSVTFKSKKESENGITFGGLIAEEVHAAGLTEFVQYAEDGTPDSLAYGAMVSICIKAIQELSAELNALKAKVGA